MQVLQRAQRLSAQRGTDLILRDLTTGGELNVGNVSEFLLPQGRRLLAVAIDATDKAGNGLQLRDMLRALVAARPRQRDVRADHLEREG